MPAEQKKFSSVRYWRFIFTPLLLGTIILGLFLLFTSSDTQVTDFGSVIQKTNSFLAKPANIGKNAGTLLNGLASTTINSV
jgi:hypothetical protein